MTIGYNTYIVFTCFIDKKKTTTTTINNNSRVCSVFRYLEKMRKDMPNKTSPSSEAIEHSTSAVSISKINNLFKPSSSTSTNKSSASSHYNSNSIGKSSTGKEVTYITKRILRAPQIICIHMQNDRY